MKGSMGGRDPELHIAGGEQLAGKICVSGSKNAALPEMAAALLTTEPVTLQNVPRVTDTVLMGEIISLLGGHTSGEGTVVIDAGAAGKTDVPDDLGRRMRATIVLLGALVARFGHARVPRPGGDDIGARRVEQHLRALRQMGAQVNETQNEIVATAERLRGGRIVFDLPTVTGTENILLAAVTADGQTGDAWFRVARDRQTPLQPIDMSTWTFPGFPTDLQAQYMALMTQADGESVISEYVHENRFQHVRELAKMGAGITVEGRLHAIVHGPCRLHGTEVAIPDIRSGAALVIAALCAEGKSLLHNAWHVERGYEDMVGKLASVGARIKSIDVDPQPLAADHTYE